MSETLDRAVLGNFTGTEHWYRHPLVRRVLYTDGVKYVADTAGAYWLVDEIAISQIDPGLNLSAEEFQVWKLSVKPDHKPTLTCEDGNGNVLHTKELSFTDFPEPGIDLWFTNNVILLPSEY